MHDFKVTISFFKKSIYALLFVGGGLLTSCKKVIELQLDNARSMVVIDAGISDQNENQTVKISKTHNFTEPNKFNGVSGARVVLTNSNGSMINYLEVAPGIYQSVKMRGVSGKQYKLDVTLDGKTYTASSTMPGKVPLDSLTFKKFNLFGKENTYLAVNYSDPVSIENQYRYILKVNGKIEDDQVNEDRFNDGNQVSDVIFYELKDLKAGDKLDVEFQCIDKHVYRYFFSLRQNNGGAGPPVSPANPISNFSNDALGIFNAYTSSKLSVVIK